MTTLPYNHPDVKHTDADHLFTLALVDASRRAFRAYPDNERALKGAQIALARKVTLLDTGYAEVASQFGTQTYCVNGTCSCPDKRRVQAGHCKHEFAAAIVRKAYRLLGEAIAHNVEDGERCPACGHQCVVVEGSRRGGTWRICRYHVELGQTTWQCGWRESVTA